MKVDLVYLVKDILSTIKLLSCYEKLEVPKSRNTRKKCLSKVK